MLTPEVVPEPPQIPAGPSGSSDGLGVRNTTRVAGPGGRHNVGTCIEAGSSGPIKTVPNTLV